MISRIKNIIFDIGNVLLKFHPNQPLEKSVSPITQNISLLEPLSKKYTLFALSDAPVKQMNFEMQKFDFFQKFEEVILSQNLGFEKNDSALYAYFLEQKKCLGSECLFIDDRLENIQAAESNDFNVILYNHTKNQGLLNLVKEFIGSSI